MQDYMNENRRHLRFNMDLSIDYQVLEIPRAHGGLFINASKSGPLVHSIKNMPVGTKLNVAVLFPRGFELANFKVLAEIVWKDIYSKESREGYQFGIKFVSIMEEDYQELNKLLGDGIEI